MRSRLGAASFVLVFALLAAACGQKDGVVNVGLVEGNRTPRPAGGEQPVGDDTADLDGSIASGGDDGQSAGGGDRGAVAGGDRDAGDPAGDDRGTGPAGTDGTPNAGIGRGSPGVSDTEIVVGFHAPLTGAAPLPQSSFKKGQSQYWSHIGKVYGRTVRAVILDDAYNPSRATSVCKELIERHKVFLMGGAGGTDQINACARVAASYGVPYFSPGVDEGNLRSLRTYFASSMSYRQQAPLLVQYVQRHAKPSNNRLGIVRDRTPGFNAVVTRVKALAEAAGLEVRLRQTQNGPSDAQWLVANQIEVAFPMMSPSTWVQIVNSPGGNIRQWVGMGITMGLNSVANTACPNIDGAMFFSPYPGLNTAERLDNAFWETGGEDDIQWALWGSSKMLHKILLGTGGELTRAKLIEVLETQVIDNGIYPVQRHRPDDHFGTDSVHVLRADCQKRQWVTPDDGLWVKGF